MQMLSWALLATVMTPSAPIDGLLADFRRLPESLMSSIVTMEGSTDEYIAATIHGGQARLRVVSMTMGQQQPLEDY